MKAIRKRKKLIIVLIIIAAVIAGLILFAKNKLRQVAEQSNRIEIETIEKRDLSDFISLTGKVSGESNKNYSSSAAAEIEQVNVAVGDEVHEGDVLAVLKKDSIQSQIDLIEKSMSDAAALNENQSMLNQHALDLAIADQKNQLAAAGQAISDAEASYNSILNTMNDLNGRISSLTDQMNEVQPEPVDEEAVKASVSQEGLTEDKYAEAVAKALEEAAKKAEENVQAKRAEFAGQIEVLQEQLAEAQASEPAAAQALNEARNNYNSIKATTDEAIYSARNTVNIQKYSKTDNTETKTQLEELYDQLANCTITAQAGGIVTAVNVSAGDVNTPNAVLISVESKDKLMMTASVDEKDILKLQEGMKAAVTSDALENQEISGVISKVIRVFGGSAAPAESSDSSAAAAAGGFSVQIELADCELLSGMTAKAKITLTDQSNVLCVPYDLVQKDESGASYVLCAEQNDDGTYTAVRKNITPGDEINYYVIVKDGDVKEGDYIIMDFSVSEGDVFEADLFSEETENGENGGTGDAGSEESAG